MLGQYFSVVREFDAHEADFERRLALLRTLRELDDAWRPGLERAIASYPDTARIPARNIALMQRLGIARLKQLTRRKKGTDQD